MSKHFELMQQMEEEHARESVSDSAGILPSGSRRIEINIQPRWANDEAMRLVQQIFLLQTQKSPQVVVFAGIEHGNGCSQLCASVAETLAMIAPKPVCVVEANFRSPGLSQLFGTANHYGLTESLLRKGPINAYANPVGPDNLWLMSSGTLAADSPNLLSSKHLRERLTELREEFAFVIIDTPPLTRYADAMILGLLSDGVVLVLEADSTRREAAFAAASNLRSAQVAILAAVLNKRTFPIPERIYRRL